MKNTTKKYIGALFTTMIGFISFQAFAIVDCPINTDGAGYSCQEYNVCNNPGSFCRCDSKNIANNSMCYLQLPSNIISIKEVSAYMTSGSQVIFSFITNNTTDGDITFKLDLHQEETSFPKIKVTDFDPIDMINEDEMTTKKGFFSPEYKLISGKRRIIVITGQMVSDKFGFEKFNIIVKATKKALGFLWPINVEEPIAINIYPIADLKLTQEKSFANYAGADVSYLFTIKNIGSATGNGPNIKDIFPVSFLTTPSLLVESTPYEFGFKAPNIYTKDGALSTLKPGEERIFTVKSKNKKDLQANDTIINTGIIRGVRELSQNNNIAVSKYIVPVDVDLRISSVETGGFEQAESDGDIIGFKIYYSNQGNTTATGVFINANISGALDITRFNLPDMVRGEYKMITITGIVKEDYPVGTKLCLSGAIGGANETAGKANNDFGQTCYTFVDHADIVTTATLTENPENIAHGDILHYTVRLKNKGGKNVKQIKLDKEFSANLEPVDTIISSISLYPGEVMNIPVKARFTGYPIGGTKLMFSVNAVSRSIEDNKFNNIFVLNTTIPTRLDLDIKSVNKLDQEPENTGDIIGFDVIYGNLGNIDAKNLKLVLKLDNIIDTEQEFALGDLSMNTTGSFVITGLIDKTFPVGTKFCLNGYLTGEGETAALTNNVLPETCYIFSDHADVKATATFSGDINNIASGDILNYNIKLENIGGKSAIGIKLEKDFSSNLVLQKNDAFDQSYSLNSGESIDISVQAKLISYPVIGTSIMFSGTAVFDGVEPDKTNNSFVLTNNLSGLADVYITHSQLAFSGFRQGDEVAFLVNYGNNGYNNASNTTIDITLPTILNASKTNWSIGDLAIGQTGSFIITGTLKDFLAAGTVFASQAKISTPSVQITTDNDTSIITGTIGTINSFAFNISAQNLTNSALSQTPYDLQTNIGAVSGDVIQFTVSYANNGNVAGTNATIGFDNVSRIALSNFNGNLGTLSVNQQSSFIVTGKVMGSNFDPVNIVSNLRYNNTGLISDSITITEPYSCGDGYITRDEQCDTAVNNNLLTGQICENQANRCVIVTRFITNTACVEYGNNQKSCSEAARVDLAPAKCGGIGSIIKLKGSYNTEVTCRGEFANTTTPASINCGIGGQIISGFTDKDGIFKGVCNYKLIETRDSSKVQCNIGNDVDNQNCKSGLDRCEIRTNEPIVIVDDQNGNGTRITCKNNKEANLKIKCNNNAHETIPENGESDFTDKISGECNYTQDDYNENPEVIATCEVDNVNSCSTEIVLDQGIFGVCGDGDLDAYEQCDLGEDGGTIGRYLDSNEDVRANSEDRNKGKKCSSHCSIVGKEDTYSCLSISNANISIQKGEYLPFRWNMYDNSTNFTNSCDNTSDDGKIIRNSMKCEIQVQNPKSKIENFTTNCNTDQWGSSIMFNYFNQFIGNKTPFGKYYIDPDNLENIIDDQFGEYKLRINKVRYDYCKDGEEKSSQTDNACETNFVITKPYLVQKSAFSTTPKYTNDISLDKFYDIKGDKLVERTDLANISILDTSDYIGNNNTIKTMMRSFADKTEKLAVSVDRASLPNTLRVNNIIVKKVPNKDIYILSTTSQTNLNLNEFASITKPFTIITKNINLIINEDISVNGMFIVNNGSINFKGGCNKTQVVKGIFVAGNGFNGSKDINDNLNKAWCNAGGLDVKGVLIGNGIQNLVEFRRSSLSSWFNVSGSNNSIKTQRRNQIFRGAAVLIEYSPDLRSQLPPGAEEFTKTLDVYKK